MSAIFQEACRNIPKPGTRLFYLNASPQKLSERFEKREARDGRSPHAMVALAIQTPDSRSRFPDPDTVSGRPAGSRRTGLRGGIMTRARRLQPEPAGAKARQLRSAAGRQSDRDIAWRRRNVGQRRKVSPDPRYRLGP